MRWLAGVLVVGMAMAEDARGQTRGNDASNGGSRARATAPWDAPPMALERLIGPVVLDGRPDEAGWGAVPPLELVQHWPDFGGPIRERSEVRIAYDDDYLYAAARFHDDPAGIRGNSLRRDRWEGDDTFELVVDSYNDDQTALRFMTTPLGILHDAEIRNDAQPGPGGGALNGDWNGYWDVATTRDAEGWSVEMRIPLSTLGFSVTNDEAVMGIIVSRYIARRDEKHIFPAIPPDWDAAEFKPSLARDVSLEGVSEQRPVWVTPYLLTGIERVRDPDAEVPVAPARDIPAEAGLDAKVGLSSNLTLDLTLNTDFAQVEADNLEVNLDRFGLFFPEKRQFFQERSSTFDFDVGEGRLFHSRRIGLSSEGDPLRIFGGARLTGRLGDWDVGVLSMQVDGAAGQPRENDGVLRLTRSFARNQQVGGMVTSRIRSDGGVDLSLGLDGRVTVGPDLVTLQVAQTRNHDEPSFTARDRSLARLFWERRRLDGLAYDLDLVASGAGYRPALGFEGRDDFRAVKANLRYSWQPPPGSFATRWMLIAHGRGFARNDDGRLESGLLRARGWGTLRGGHFVNLALNFFREEVREAFELPGAVVPPGRYDGRDVFLRFQLNQARSLGTGLTIHVGDMFDGRRTSITVDPWWRLNRHFILGGLVQHTRLSFPQRAQEVDADIARLRVSAALDTRLSAEAFVQYSAAADALSTNLRVRYRFAEGRDLYLVLDEGRDLDDHFGADSAILGRTDRRLLIKYTWAFRP